MKIKKQIDNSLKAVFMGMMALLGYSCDKENYICEYGSPTTDYQTLGKVTDTDGNPIPGIKVEVGDIAIMNEDGLKDFYAPKVAYTDKKGEFYAPTFRSSNFRPTVRFTDVDGEENGGEFNTVEKSFETYPSRQISKGDGHWFTGTYEVTINEQLKPKAAQATEEKTEVTEE